MQSNPPNGQTPPMAPQQSYGPPSGMLPQPPKGMAVASMVCGIVGACIFCIWYVSIPLAIIAIILGAIAIGKANRGEAGGAGMAKAGLILGIITIGVVVILLIVGVAFYSSIMEQLQNQQQGR